MRNPCHPPLQLDNERPPGANSESVIKHLLPRRHCHAGPRCKRLVLRCTGSRAWNARHCPITFDHRPSNPPRARRDGTGIWLSFDRKPPGETRWAQPLSVRALVQGRNPGTVQAYPPSHPAFKGPDACCGIYPQRQRDCMPGGLPKHIGILACLQETVRPTPFPVAPSA
jgi:hypothetical protein